MFSLSTKLSHKRVFTNFSTILHAKRWVSQDSEDPLKSYFKNKDVFQSKSTSELIRALTVFSLCSCDTLVDNQDKMMNVCRKLFGDRLFDGVMRKTFFSHFVAGEDFQTVQIYLKRLENMGVGGIIDYAVESDLEMVSKDNFDIKFPYIVEELKKKSFRDRYTTVSTQSRSLQPPVDNDSFSWKLNSFLESIKVTANSKLGSFVAVKLTSLINPPTLLEINTYVEKMREVYEKSCSSPGKMTHDDFMKAVSELKLLSTTEDIAAAFKIADSCKQGFLSWYDWIFYFHPSIYHRDIYQCCPDFFLNRDQWWEMVLLMARVSKIIDLTKALSVRIMVDAEQSYFQSAIHLITVDMQTMANLKSPLVYNTYQCYLKKTDRTLEEDLRYASLCSNPFILAAKCVRGAYVTRETLYAEEHGRENPIHPNYEATSACYNRSITRMLDGVLPGKTSICVASHNVDSIILAIRKIEELKIDPHSRDVSFGQLLGMYDHLTFGLAKMGYHAYKYLPFGPVKDVMPYLARRAVENKSIMKKTSDEINILMTELKSRFYNPFSKL